jgi:hypothetical protein
VTGAAKADTEKIKETAAMVRMTVTGSVIQQAKKPLFLA